MRYRDYCKSTATLKKKLLELHLSCSEGDTYCNPSKPLEKWFSNFFKKFCGLGLGDGFKEWTLWGQMQGRQANFKTYFRPEKVNPKWDDQSAINIEGAIKYRVFLSTHNLDADTDMSDGLVMYIEFQVKNNKVYNYSFHFDP